MHEQATASTHRPTRKAAKTAATHRDDIPTKTPGVYRRGKGDETYFSVRFTDADGKRRRERFDTEDDAILYRAEATRDVKRGTYRKVEAVTFKEYAEQWAVSYRGRGRTPIRERTRKTYGHQIAGAVAFLGGISGRKPLAAITSDDIAAFIDHLYGLGNIPDTVHRHMTPLKMVMSQALREARITTDPSKGIPLIPSDPSLMPPEADEDERAKALTHDEMTSLLAHIPKEHMLMTSLMLQTGLRISEALGLRWQDVDRESREVRVRQRVVEAEVGPPKSKRSRRSVPVADDLLRDLAVWRLSSSHSDDGDLVFGTASGKPAWASNHGRWFKKAAREAGVDWVTFHNLRHTAASRWFHSGYMLTVVSKLLGHADPAFTLRTYIHVIPSDLPDGRDLAAAIGL